MEKYHLSYDELQNLPLAHYRWAVDLMNIETEKNKTPQNDGIIGKNGLNNTKGR